MEQLPDFLCGFSIDLWANVLSKAVGGVADKSDLRFLSARGTFAQQASFYRLRLVCKRFNQVFLEYPHLSRGLILTKQGGDPLSSNPSLLGWLKRFGGSVQTLALCHGDQGACDVLALLASSSTALRSVLAQAFKQVAMSHLAACKHLVALELVAPASPEPLQLDLLQELSSLETLVLQNGNFTAEALPCNLSCLQLTEAAFEIDQLGSARSSLKRLKLSASTWWVLLEVLILDALEDFTCLESDVKGEGKSYLLTSIEHVFSISTRHLRQWACLKYLDMTAAAAHHCPLSTLYPLVNLQDLSVHSRGGSLHVSQGLSMMSQLTSLTLLASSEDASAFIYLYTDWSGLHALQLLHVSCDEFVADSRILTMLQLQELQRVSFSNGSPHGDTTTRYFAALVHEFARRRTAQLCVGSDMLVDQLLADKLGPCVATG